jgi:hypothetical protein
VQKPNGRSNSSRARDDGINPRLYYPEKLAAPLSGPFLRWANIPLNDYHLRARGLIVVRFNELEEEAEFTLQVLMGKGTPAAVWQALTVGESFDRLIFKIGTLARLRLSDPDFLTDLDEWMREAKEVQEDRNRVVHSGWVHYEDLEPDVATAMRMTAKHFHGQSRNYTRAISKPLLIASGT